jgi:hypothetical protein
MDSSVFSGESNTFIITAVMMVGYEVVKNLVNIGLRTKSTVEEALWKKSVTDSLAALITATTELKQQQQQTDIVRQGRK